MTSWILRAVPVVSITIAVLLLLLLLAVSTSSVGESFRRIDMQVQYAKELVVALDQRISRSLVGRSEYHDSIAQMSMELPSSFDTIDRELRGVYRPESELERMRQSGTVLFNLIDTQQVDLADGTALQGGFADVSDLAERVSDYMSIYLNSATLYASGRLEIADDARTLVQALRSTGRGEVADQVFRAGNQILEYLQAGDAQRLQRIDGVLGRLESVMGSLGDDERDIARGLLTSVPAMVLARQTMNDTVSAMDLTGLAKSLSEFRERATVDYVFALSMINDARVLLNLYTVLLLCALAYFGMRLRASYHDLNKSHGQLEVRVRERTADLEEAYDDLKESQVQLVQAEKMSSLGQLVAGVMHEINTPLLYVLNNTSVTSDVVGELRGYVDATMPLLEAQSPADIAKAVKQLVGQRNRFEAESIREGMEEIASLSNDSIDGLHQISDLVQSLKDFSRLDRAGEDRFNVRDGIEKTLTITRNLLKYGIEVEREFAEVDDIYCAPARVNQIFVNLVTNAAQAMDGKGTLTIEVDQDDDFVEVAFTDTGCGISEENLEKIMDPFFTTKPVGQGTGLGLSIVRQIVDQHHGEINVDSEEGVGTRITVRLPRHPIAGEEAA